ncbi:MAG: PKD domain-containing protein, partial [Bacteroidota bacterium]
ALETNSSKTYSWNIGGGLLRTGREIDHIFFDAGGFLVTLEVADSSGICSSRQHVDVSLANQAPVGSCFFNTWKTEENTYAFETWMPWYFADMSYSIDFDDGTVLTDDPQFGVPLSHTYSRPGTYEICQTMNADGCSYCKEIVVGAEMPSECNAEFTYEIDSSYGVWIYTFTASEIDAGKNYSWTTFEGNQVPLSGTRIESFVFPSEGTYPVELTVFDDSDTCSTVQQIYAPNTESCTFGITQDENRVTVKAAWGFNDNWFTDDLIIDTTQYAVEYLYYSINLGDGAVVNGTLFARDSIEWTTPFIPDIDHEYASPGVYDICYSATDSLFYSCQQCKSVIIEESDLITCDPTFTYVIDSTSTENWIYTFNAADPDSTKQFVWGFDQQRIGFGRSEEHIFTEGGAQEVNLFVYENEADTCFSSVMVYPPEGEGCFMNVTQFDANTFDFYPTVNATARPVYYNMDFGDSVSTSGVQTGGRSVGPFSYHYRTDGFFEACFTATDSVSFSCEVCEQIEVIFPECYASFVYHKLDSANQFRYLFTALEISAQYDYRWEINGQTVSENELFEFTFPSTGSYEVELYMTNISNGDVCTSRKTITVDSVIPTCPTSFVYHLGDSSDIYSYVFTPLVIDSQKSFQWEIEGLFVSEEILLDYTFPGTGSYEVTLYVTEDGESCSTSRTIVVQDENSTCDASFDFEIDPANSFSYTFTARSDSAVAYEWFLNGVLASENLSFHYTFPDSGTYEVRLDILRWWDSCSSSQNVLVPAQGDPIVADSLYIQGFLFADLIPVDDGAVALYKKANGSWKYSSEVVTTAGEFVFNNLSSGNYLIHARGDEFIHQAFIPTYFVNGVGWQDAYELELSGSAEEVEITLIRSQALSAGQGQLQGRVAADELDLPFVLLLKDRSSGRTVKWAVSEEEHRFNFDQLPFGQYKITVERPSMSFSKNFDLNENQSTINNIELRTDAVLGQEEVFSGGLHIYPTKVEDHVFLRNQTHAGGDTRVDLQSISGKRLMSEHIIIEARETVEITLPRLEAGVYLMRVIDHEGKTSVTKLIK